MGVDSSWNTEFPYTVAETYLHTNSTQRVVTDAGVNTSVRISMTLIYIYVSDITFTDLSPVPVRSAVKLYFTSWSIQNLSNRGKWHLDASSCLATIEMVRKLGRGTPPHFWGRELGPRLAQCGLYQGPLPCQVPSWYIQPFEIYLHTDRMPTGHMAVFRLHRKQFWSPRWGRILDGVKSGLVSWPVCSPMPNCTHWCRDGAWVWPKNCRFSIWSQWILHKIWWHCSSFSPRRDSNIHRSRQNLMTKSILVAYPLMPDLVKTGRGLVQKPLKK